MEPLIIWYTQRYLPHGLVVPTVNHLHRLVTTAADIRVSSFILSSRSWKGRLTEPTQSPRHGGLGKSKLHAQMLLQLPRLVKLLLKLVQP